MKFVSNAKINIGLNVISNRIDGYHNLETIFYPINYSDELEFIESDQFSIECNDPNIPTDSSNLIWKAKDLIQEKSSDEIKVKVKLLKRIPSFAGLGGGSSNAAITLMALNQILNINLTQDELQSIAVRIGADVPYFLENKPCFAEGRGEILFPLSDFQVDGKIVVVFPKINISTAWAYSNIAPKHPNFSLASIKTFSDFLNNLNAIENDFERPVFNKYPEIGEIKNILLGQGAIYSSLSGSGSAVYGIFPLDTKLEHIKSVFSNYEVFEC